MKYEVIATIGYVINRYLEIAEKGSYYSKVYLKGTNCKPIATFDDLQSINVSEFDKKYDVINYGWFDDVITIMLQSKEEMTND